LELNPEIYGQNTEPCQIWKLQAWGAVFEFLDLNMMWICGTYEHESCIM